MTIKPILDGLTTAPNAAKYQLYRWCDYLEIRCLTHKDKKFSRDNLQEAIGESKDVAEATATAEDWDEDEVEAGVDNSHHAVEALDDAEAQDDDETYVAGYFHQLKWRSIFFGDSWPFTIDAHAKEIALKEELTTEHYLYLQLLLSALLEYCPATRRKPLTQNFEHLSVSAMTKLMPQGSKVHQFGAGNSTKYVGHLYDRLVTLADDLHGKLILSRADFGVTNAGDGGLDIVAWQDLGDQRDGMPIAFAQCGCTANGWPDKSLEASPARLGKKIVVVHDWTTFYFTPLDLAVNQDGRCHWQNWLDIAQSIMIDRYRLLKLSEPAELEHHGYLRRDIVNEALAIVVT